MKDLIYKPEDLAEYLGVTVGALAQMRYRGNGPKFVKLGKSIRYSDAAIQEWLEQNTKDRT